MFLGDLIMVLLNTIILVVGFLMGVASLTLLERNVFGYIQIRKSPNKVGYMGISQPVSDAIKLFTNEQTYPLISNFILYFLSPAFSLFLSLALTGLYAFYYSIISF